MLSLILRRDFFKVWPKNFFSGSFKDPLLVSKVIFLKFSLFFIEFLMRMLRPLCACWAYGTGTYAHAESARKELMHALSIRVRNWCVHWAYASGTKTCTERSPFKTCWTYASETDAYFEHTGQELMRALSIRVRNWCVHWAYASGTDAHAQRAHHKFFLSYPSAVPVSSKFI